MRLAKFFAGAFLLATLGTGCGGDDAAGPLSGGAAGVPNDASVNDAGNGGRGGAGVGTGTGTGNGGSGGSTSSGASGSSTSGGAGGGGGAATGGSNGDGSIFDGSPDVSTGGSTGAGGSAGSAGSTGVDGSTPTDGSGSDGTVSCGVFNDLCSSGATCCSGICDPKTNACGSTVGKCFAEGTPCAAPTDCCSLNCGANGFCGATPCVSDGQSCSDGGGTCCSGKCGGTTCTPLNPSCRTAGNECTTGDQCCSHLCKDGHCALGGSYCIQTGDACVRGSDCCGGICNIAAGASLGTCDVPAPGGTRCSGAVDGSFCNGCGTCCSRLCAPYALTGVFICQPANGCHIDGDLCVRDQDCCGNDMSLPTSGHNVQCVREHPSDSVGVCRNPMGCSPEGNVCHYKQDDNYACNVSSAPNNCCGATGNSGACQLDALGVPRCHGIPVCRAPGETCAYTGDCCNGVPCVPDSTGQLRCLIVPDGGRICVPATGGCTVTADCCPGNVCVVPQGSTLGTCGPLTPPPPDGGTTPDGGGNDGSTPPPDDGSTPPPDDGAPPDGAPPPDDGATPPPDGPPVCSQYGQICNGNSDCCNAIPCTGGICRIPPM